MAKIFQFFKYVIISILIAILAIYIGAYLLLSIPAIQQKIKDISVSELKAILKSEVSIREVSIEPFNKITLSDVYLQDLQGDTMLYSRKISAGFEIFPLLQKKLIITTVQLFGSDIRLNKKEPKAPLNAQFLIDALRPNPKTPLYLAEYRVNAVLIRQGNFRFDILSEPHKPSKIFDKNHIDIKNLFSTLSLKLFTQDTISAHIKRLSFEEESGLNLKRLALRINANRKKLMVKNLDIQLPNTQIQLDSASLNYTNVDSLKTFNNKASLSLNIKNGTVSLPDLACFVPVFKKIASPLQIVSLELDGSPNALNLNKLVINSKDFISINAKGNVTDISTPDATFIFGKVETLHLSANGLNEIINSFSKNPKENKLIYEIGALRFNGEISGFLNNLVAFGNLSSKLGTIHSDILLSNDRANGTFAYNGKISTKEFNLHPFNQKNNLLGKISLFIDIDGIHSKTGRNMGKLKGNIKSFDLNGYSYENIQLNGNFNGWNYDGFFLLDDPNGYLEMTGKIDLLNKIPVFQFTAKANHLKLHELKLTKKYQQADLSFNVLANFTGNSIDNANGTLSIDSTTFTNGENRFFLNTINISANNESVPKYFSVTSNILNGKVIGQYSFKTLPQSIYQILSAALPALFYQKNQTVTSNDFYFDFTLNNTQKLSSVLELPVSINEECALNGYISDPKKQFRIKAEVPDLKINKFNFDNINAIIEKSDKDVNLRIGGNNINKKKQYIPISFIANASGDSLAVKFNWSNTATSTFSGQFSALSHFVKQEGNFPLSANININPTDIILNDSVWQVRPSTILIDSGRIAVNKFEVSHNNQYLQIDGNVSGDKADELYINLNDFSLDYLFETLNIKHVVFGGTGSGSFVLSNLTNAPIIATKSFLVKNFSYNHAPLGDLNLFSRWDAESQGILLQGKISQKEMPDTKIDGHIFPTRDSLSLYFDTYKLNAAFLRPFVNTIMTNLSGDIYGKLNFYGKFSALNVVGDAFLNNINFGIDYLNTTYTLSDSIHLTPESIKFNNISIYDRDRHSAKIQGTLLHKNFKNLSYDIAISNAQNLLVFNVTELQNPVYYGKVYGSGTASIRGEIGKTNIDVNMRTDDKSIFSYVLSDTETAGDYQFITFVNKREQLAEKESAKSENHKPDIQPTVEKGNDLNINLQIDATPLATMQLIMDPSTGDIIKANGNGSIRIEYGRYSDMKIYGTYTLDKGSYKFSLQDIITRDFMIKQGSSVTFRGNPMAAILDISATYTVTANLRDLDENFADDKEISRTNVPVQTILNVSGDLQRPDLSFNIELPSLSQDVERRVKSIIGSDDMMNRQIIYLLALSKFYTPDYMNVGQNKNNELASVASSTLSSQLNNLLNQISDNWNIGTNIRSDKGDFSDVEFELALSSQLLNNRLIFNGNFGYRDNQTNNNTFIGDFDLEYLLNRSGNLRLKAYNHYNDRNYYIKSALTTQGVGLVFKRDFLRFSELFSRLNPPKNSSEKQEKKTKKEKKKTKKSDKDQKEINK